MVVRIANQCNKIQRGRLPGQISLVKIATEDFGLTVSQYQRVLLNRVNDQKQSARERSILRIAA